MRTTILRSEQRFSWVFCRKKQQEPCERFRLRVLTIWKCQSARDLLRSASFPVSLVSALQIDNVLLLYVTVAMT